MPTENRMSDVTAQFERAVVNARAQRYVLRLYLAGSSVRSLASVSAVKAFCEEYLRGRYELEVVDLFQQPERAQDAQVIAAPTLVKEVPLPLRRLIGDLTDPGRVMIALNIVPEDESEI